MVTARAMGEITMKMTIGDRFMFVVIDLDTFDFTFVVIDLDTFDFIIGLPDIERERMELSGSHLPIVIKGRGGPGKGASNLELSVVIRRGSVEEPFTHTLMTLQDFRRVVGDDR